MSRRNHLARGDYGEVVMTGARNFYNLRACPREHRAVVLHAISPILVKLPV